MVSAQLGATLEAEAVRIAAAAGFRRRVPAFHRVNVSRAQLVAGARCRQPTSSDLPSTAAPGPVTGRMQRAVVEGVEVVLDAAHNPQAWQALAAELPSRYVAVVSVSLDKPAAALASTPWALPPR